MGLGSCHEDAFNKKAPWPKTSFLGKKKKTLQFGFLWNLSYQNPKLGEMTAKLEAFSI